ncbi:MAG: 23S rRNA (pseudouridine(1915)-N(3))-methyltransferase RlmH [Desulfovibrionaceae bacterium]|nr:23S rRNA (pseudouridine(1915)-N(3))-methyltransferase RlmH [Desulfovibrionaceae bacterium]
MAGRPFHILCVGKLKQAFAIEGTALYRSRLEKWRALSVTEIRDSTLPKEKMRHDEGLRLKKAMASDAIPFVLDERGQLLTSKALAGRIRDLDTGGYGTVTFIIGGPYGLDESILKSARMLLSLSPMTLPHEMARLVLLEQLYRAETILRNTPYHHS